ncbi:hypothetical protein BKA62DRAFT_691226 [Auriculariales sp. MPI-PUGE-AT-0066]|nr:hypothetical protein BKA62DRAFT_691226 [Auriculariales sp. MPI-PUGE-AT-0066]
MPPLSPRLSSQFPPSAAYSILALKADAQSTHGSKAAPPPIDPGVFRSVLNVRRLVEEATDLAVRAACGLSSAALNSMSSGFGGAHAYGMGNIFGDVPSAKAKNGGRSVAMSPTRAHRLRALAVQRLAQAYKADEIAASVMVMQGATSLDDIAGRVLAVDPTDLDAQYVHFFHEKIPSRQLAEHTTTELLDSLIAAQPQRLEYFRTRGIVHCFREEYTKAVRDFTHALKETRAARKARTQHSVAQQQQQQHGAARQHASDCATKRKKGAGSPKVNSNGRAPVDGTAVAVDTDGLPNGACTTPLAPHPSAAPDAPDPMEPQLLFLRGAAYLAQAVSTVERAILELENVRKPPIGDGCDLRLTHIANGRYGGLELGHPDGPLGQRGGTKALAYIQRFASDAAMRESVVGLARKAMRDFERFLAHFDSLPAGQLGLSDDSRLGAVVLVDKNTSPPLAFTTYHPLLVEAHFSCLVALMLLGDCNGINIALARARALVDGLEGYPVFLPARSMAQAEFIEACGRLKSGWANGKTPSATTSPRETSAGSRLDAIRTMLQSLALDTSTENNAGAEGSSLNFPLHGPRVDVLLAWLGAVYLPELDSEADAERVLVIGPTPGSAPNSKLLPGPAGEAQGSD